MAGMPSAFQGAGVASIFLYAWAAGSVEGWQWKKKALEKNQ